MAYSLLAYLYPRIKGSQEDVATFSLGYILEQSEILNESFTKMILDCLRMEQSAKLVYRCQDADNEFGRPDIAAYQDGQLKILLEAKFYAGLTDNQPVSYIKRLSDFENAGLVFICPRNRLVSLWDKLRNLAAVQFKEVAIGDYLSSYDGTRMSIITWDEILADLIHIAAERDPDRLGDLKQLNGFCEKIDSESFIPFRPEEFGAQTARDIDRYYQVVDETYRLLLTHKELDPQTKGLRKAPRWQGFSQYLRLNGLGVSIDHIRTLWKSPASLETPFWFHIWDTQNKNSDVSEKLAKYYASLDAKMMDDFYGTTYLALVPKPYLTLEETAEDLTNQIIRILMVIEKL